MTGDKLTKKVTSMKGAIEFLTHCRDTHQGYIENAHWRRGNVGRKPHHEKCVARYNETINVIKKRRVKE